MMKGGHCPSNVCKTLIGVHSTIHLITQCTSDTHTFAACNICTHTCTCTCNFSDLLNIIFYYACK